MKSDSASARVVSDEQPGGRPPAPPALRLVQEFVNSLDVEAGHESLATPAQLGDWLRARGLPAPRRPSTADVAHAHEVREALRDLCLANHDHHAAWTAGQVIDDAARRAGLRLDGATLRLVPDAGGVDAAIGTLLVAVTEAVVDGSSRRLKACSADLCRWAFWDGSRNNRGRWCSMALCGNRAKARAHRARGQSPS